MIQLLVLLLLLLLLLWLRGEMATKLGGNGMLPAAAKLGCNGMLSAPLAVAESRAWFQPTKTKAETKTETETLG